MVADPEMSNRSREPVIECISYIFVAATRKGSRSSPEKKGSMEEQMDQDVSVLASRLEEEFSCVSSSASPGIWYINSWASAHMTRVRECFSNYQEEQMNFKITIGKKAKCTPIGRGSIVFQTEVGNKLRATNVLHVPGLGMNLLSMSQLQNKGYGVYFIGKRVYVKHSSWKKKAQIGVRSNRIYKLQLISLMALMRT